MRTYDLEKSLRRYFEEALVLPQKHKERVVIHWAGDKPPQDNAAFLIVPRFTAAGRRGPRDGDVELITVQVTVAMKINPVADQFGLLSLLVDQVRLVVDQSLKGEDVFYDPDDAAIESTPLEGLRGAAPIYDRTGQQTAALDFGPAQETRADNASITVGGVTLSPVNLAVLTTTALLSPMAPRVMPRT